MKKILITVMAVALCLGLIGSAFAYFSDTETSEGNTFTAGTLDLQLSNSPDWSDGVTATWMSPAGWAPGDVVTATLRMKNVGTIGSECVLLRPVALTESDNDYNEPEGADSANNIADYINVTNFQLTFVDTATNTSFYAYGNWAPGWMADVWGTGGAPLTLAEFYGTPYKVVVWGSSRSDDALEANGADIIELTMTFEFEPTAPNDYQSDQCIMDFRVGTGKTPADVVVIWASESPPGYGYAIE